MHASRSNGLPMRLHAAARSDTGCSLGGSCGRSACGGATTSAAAGGGGISFDFFTAMRGFTACFAGMAGATWAAGAGDSAAGAGGTVGAGDADSGGGDVASGVGAAVAAGAGASLGAGAGAGAPAAAGASGAAAGGDGAGALVDAGASLGAASFSCRYQPSAPITATIATMLPCTSTGLLFFAAGGTSVMFAC